MKTNTEEMQFSKYLVLNNLCLDSDKTSHYVYEHNQDAYKHASGPLHFIQDGELNNLGSGGWFFDRI